VRYQRLIVIEFDADNKKEVAETEESARDLLTLVADVVTITSDLERRP
jgi:hypothetical protein